MGCPELHHFANDLGLGLGVGLLRARGSDLRVDIAELLRRQRGVVRSDEQIGVAAERRDLRLGIGHLFLHRVDLAGQPLHRGARLILLGRTLTRQVLIGNGIGDVRGQFRVLREKIDNDDVRLVDRIGREPVVIGFKDALLRRHARRVLDQSQPAEHDLERRNPVQGRIEFGALVELQLGDHVACEVAREDKLNLAGHRLFVDRIAVDQILIGVRAQVHVVAALDENPRFREVFGWDNLDDGERDQRYEQGGTQDFPFAAPERRAKRGQVELRVDQRTSARRPRRLRRHAHHITPRRPTKTQRASQTIKVSIRLRRCL